MPEEPPQKVTFSDCVIKCSRVPEFVKGFNRLTGCSFGKSLDRKPIELMIDEACGYSGESDDDIRQFIAFVYEVVWSRLPEEAFQK